MNNNSNGTGDINIQSNNAVNNTQTLNSEQFFGANRSQVTNSTPNPTNQNRGFQAQNHINGNRADRSTELLVNRNANRENTLQTIRQQTLQNELPYYTELSNELDDQRQYNNIISSVQYSQPLVPTEITCTLGDFALGTFYTCKGCGHDVSVLYQSNDDIIFVNPGTTLLPLGHIDINNKVIVFCEVCKQEQRITQCNFLIDRPRYINIINNTNIEYARIFCSNRFIGEPGLDKCDECRTGKIRVINNKRVVFTGRYGGCQYKIVHGNNTSTYNFGTFTNMNNINSFSNNNNPNGCSLM